MTYLFAMPLFRQGAARALESDDLPPEPARDRVEVVTARIARAWALESARPAPSFAWCLLSAFRREVAISGALFFVDFASVVAQSALLRPTIFALGNGDVAVTASWIVALIALGVVKCVVSHTGFYVLMRTGWFARAVPTL